MYKKMVQSKKAMSIVTGTMLLIVLTLSAVVIIYSLALNTKSMVVLSPSPSASPTATPLQGCVKEGTVCTDKYGKYSDFCSSPNQITKFQCVNNLCEIQAPADCGVSMFCSKVENKCLYSSSLVSYWKFDEETGKTAIDSADGNHGTIYGASRTEGIFNNALKFDGGYVSVADSSSLDLTKKLTIGLWVYPEKSGDNLSLIAKNQEAGKFSYYFALNNSKPAIYLGGLNNPGWHEATEALTLNEWHYVAFTFDGSNLKIYVNGALNKTISSLTGSININSQPLWIGSRKDSTSYNFIGKIDEVKIYNLNLTAEEIKQEYERYTLRPVTIQGTRFYSDGEPYFLSANFLSSGNGFWKDRYNQIADVNSCTMLYFSPRISEYTKREMRSRIYNEDYNAISIYTVNENDYATYLGYSAPVTPYKNSFFGGAFDETKIQKWRKELIHLIHNGIRPVLWLFPDDALAIHNEYGNPHFYKGLPDEASVKKLEVYIKKMVDSFDDLPVMWVLGLEVNEYWYKKDSDVLGEYLQSIAKNLVGLHQTGGKTDYMTSDWVDFGVYQYGTEKSWQEIYEETLTKRQTIANKPFIAGEYDLSGGTIARQRGLAAAFAGAAGAGNGAPHDLDEFMQTLPDNMVSYSPDVYPSLHKLCLKGDEKSVIAYPEHLNFYEGNC